MDNCNKIAQTSAAKSSIQAENDRALRVPCYCEENVWRLAYRRNNTKREQKQQQQHQPQQLHNSPNELDASTTMYDYVVFISNPLRSCPMYYQKARENECCVWDYHVILLSSSKNINDDKEVINDATNARVYDKSALCSSHVKKSSVTKVYDIDSVLPYPCSLEEYIQQSFCFLFCEEIEEKYKIKYAPWFRLMKAETFLKHFFSDRSHMFDKQNGVWYAPPPAYDCIMVGEKDDGDDETNDDKIISKANTSISPSHGCKNSSNLQMYITMNEQDNIDLVDSCSNNRYGLVLNLENLRRVLEIK